MSQITASKPESEVPFGRLFGEEPSGAISVDRTAYDHDLQLQVIPGTREPAVKVREPVLWS
jgi:hypothetical protein